MPRSCRPRQPLLAHPGSAAVKNWPATWPAARLPESGSDLAAAMFKSLKTAVGSLGFTNGMLYLLGRAMQAVSGGRCFLIRYYLVAQPVPSPFSPVCKPSPNDQVREAGQIGRASCRE